MSTNGSYIYDYIGYKSFTYEQMGCTVLFPSGSEFLICKVSHQNDANTGQQKTDIYLRNVCLGLSRGETFLWIDDMFTSSRFIQ